MINDILSNPFLQALVLAVLAWIGYRNRQRLAKLLHSDPTPQVRDFLKEITEAQSVQAAKPVAASISLPTAWELSDSVQTVKLSTVAASDNVLVVGQKGAGKTTLLRKIIAARSAEMLIALDPHAHPGKWPCTIIGGGRNYPAIGEALEQIEANMDERFKKLAAGTEKEGDFPRRSVVTDEYRSIADKLNGKGDTVNAGTLLLNRISEGRKVGECALVACHNDTGEALGITGNTDMKTCFDYIVYMGGLVDSQRTQKCPPEIKAAALRRQRPAVAWLTEKNQWFVLDDDLAMPEVSSNPTIQEGGTSIPVREFDTENASTEPHTGTRTSTVLLVDADVQLDHDIKLLHKAGVSWNKIAEQLQLKGQKQQRNARIRQALGILEAVEYVEAE